MGRPAPQRHLQPGVSRVVRLGVLVIACGLLVPVGFVLLPLPPGLLDGTAPTSLRVLDRTGGVLREAPSRDGHALALPVEEPPPPQLVQAFVAAEDRRFGLHPGVDVLAVARAVRDNLRAARVVSGASTLAQQLARQLVPRERTLAGKLQEALWALRLTAHLPR